MSTQQKPLRHWNQVNYIHKNQQSLDESSSHSVQSNNSIRFSKFKFNKQQKPHPSNFKLISKRLLTKQSNQNNYIHHDIQSKGQQTQRHKIIRNDSKISNNSQLNQASSNILQNKQKIYARYRLKQKQMKNITIQLASIITNLKQTINIFNKRYIFLKQEWERSFKYLLSSKVIHQNNQVKKNIQNLKGTMDKLYNDIKKPIDHAMVNKQMCINSHQSLNTLTLSPIKKNNVKELSRVNTLASILGNQLASKQKDINEQDIKGKDKKIEISKQSQQYLSSPTYKMNKVMKSNSQLMLNYNMNNDKQGSNRSKLGSSQMNSLTNAIKRIKGLFQR